MASVAKIVMEEATCPTCKLLMTDPMIIDCGHSFCHGCITSNNKHQQREKIVDGMYVCALCRHTFQKKNLRPNKNLQSIIETIRNICYEKFCEEHGEKLHLYCEDDDQLICFCCERQPQHRGHVMVLAEDVCQDYKGKLQNAVTKLREDEFKCNNRKLFFRKQRMEWEKMVNIERQNIRSEFENLHKFLCNEKKHFLRRLEEEKEKTLRKLQEGEDKLEKQSQDLQYHILKLERKCQDSAQNLMEGVKVTLRRSFEVKLELPEAVSLDLHTLCNVNVPKLYFDVRKVLKRYQVNVTLDPETAHDNLLLSEDGKKVINNHPQQKPHSASRFIFYPSVLGCEGFTSGRHYFEVYVEEESPYYALGVCLANVHRVFTERIKPELGFWAIWHSRDKGIQALSWPRLPLVQEHLSIVGVFVDYEAGLVSFYNAETGSHIFTFPKASFSHTLFPFFLLYESSSLIMIPPGISVKK